MAVAADSLHQGVTVAASSRRAFYAYLMTPNVPDVLAELLRRPAWMADALCREHPEVNFFPELGQKSEPAKAVCRGCLVREECAAYAAEREDFGGGGHGIWGGLSARERRKLRKSVA